MCVQEGETLRDAFFGPSFLIEGLRDFDVSAGLKVFSDICFIFMGYLTVSLV